MQGLTGCLPKDYPRVLVVDATPFCRHMNNGIVKSNLFQGWPKSALAQVMYSNIQPGFDVCEQYWMLRKTAILRGAIGLEASDAVRLTAGGCIGTPYDPEHAHTFESRPRLERLLSQLGEHVRTPIGEGLLRLPSVLSPTLRQWIERFSPDVVFTLGGNAPILRLAAKVAEWREIPLVPYFTDDWISSIYDMGLFSSSLRASCAHWFRRSLRLAPIRLAISDALGQEYELRYGGRFETFMNSGDPFESQAEPVSRTVRFSFIGSLAPNRWRSLAAIGRALGTLKERGANCELLIYTFPADIRQFGAGLQHCGPVTIVGTARPDELERLYSEANILVHAESFDDATRRYTRYSLSTKIPQYLMAARCVLAYGPAEAASVQYISDNEVGLAVSEEDEDHLCCELSKLISSPSLRTRFARRGRQVALARHDSNLERQRFQSVVCEARQARVLADRGVAS